MTEHGQSLIHEAGRWQVHLGRRELLAGGAPVPIGARAFEIIGVLIQSANELITKHDLMDRVWPGAEVGENTLHVHVSAIRKALGQDRDMLQTVSGRGYRLLGRWTVGDTTGRVPAAGLVATQRTVEPVRSNLPAVTAGLIGRSAAVQEIHELLSIHRMVTLTGPGGVGKTALALRVSHDLAREFDGEVWFVELAALSDPGFVLSKVACVLGLKPGEDGLNPKAIAQAVGDKKLILVLDSCEHVIDAAAELAETLVRWCPRARVLATSRELLRIDGEYVYRVPPLDVPPTHQIALDDCLGHSAVQLFVAKIQELDSSFPAREQDVGSIAAICRHLDGIPLAIEFAAARAATLGIQHVASNLVDRFGLLTSGRRTALARHQTLRATFDWSYELLPETERRLLGRLAIFTTGFTLQAAIAVMNEPEITTRLVQEGITNLVAKSLVIPDRSVPSGRWALLETIRAYAFEKLVESGEIDVTARCHAQFHRDRLAPLDDAWSPTCHRSAFRSAPAESE
jgi:predicted ATPase/DNA-binding winged helix-turn-helix (wHTH) protein